MKPLVLLASIASGDCISEDNLTSFKSFKTVAIARLSLIVSYFTTRTSGGVKKPPVRVVCFWWCYSTMNNFSTALCVAFFLELAKFVFTSPRQTSVNGD